MGLSGVTEWVFWGGAAVIMIGMMAGAFLDERRLERRIYWLSWLAGGLIMMLAVNAQAPSRTLGIAGFCVAMSVMMAFFRTPYLKVGNTIYAASSGDRQPDPPRPGPADGYGTASAATVWWLLAIVTGAGAIVVWNDGWTSSSSVAAGIFIACAGAIGILDSAGDFPRFRSQYVPAGVLTVVSIPLYCAPPLLYLLCYEIATWLRGGRASRPGDE